MHNIFKNFPHPCFFDNFLHHLLYESLEDLTGLVQIFPLKEIFIVLLYTNTTSIKSIDGHRIYFSFLMSCDSLHLMALKNANQCFYFLPDLCERYSMLY